MIKFTFTFTLPLVLVVACVFGAATGTQLSSVSARAACGPRRIEQCSFVDRFTSFNTKRWGRSFAYDNGPPFNSWWAVSNAAIDKPRKHLVLAVTRRYNGELDLPYASGEIKSNGRYSYGCYEIRARPSTQPGVITGFFIYTDRFNARKGRPTRVNSINLGFLYQPRFGTFSYRMTLTRNGRQGPIQDIYPSFKLEQSFHNYGFKFTGRGVDWYIDGFRVFSVRDNTPKAADGPFRIFLNTWVVKPAAGFGGRFVFRGRGVTRIAALRYQKGENCQFSRRSL